MSVKRRMERCGRIVSLFSMFFLAISISLPLSLQIHASENEKIDDPQQVTRKKFEESLDQIKIQAYNFRLPNIQEKFNVFRPNIFISYAWDEETKKWVDQQLSKDLTRLGFNVLYDQEGILAGHEISVFEERVNQATYVIVLGTPKYMERYRDHQPLNPSKSTGVGREMEKIARRLSNQHLKGSIFPIYRGGYFQECVPDPLHSIAAFNATDDTAYYDAIFTVAQSFFLFEKTNSEPIYGIRERFSSFKKKADLVDMENTYLLGIGQIKTGTDR